MINLFFFIILNFIFRITIYKKKLTKSYSWLQVKYNGDRNGCLGICSFLLRNEYMYSNDSSFTVLGAPCHLGTYMYMYM